MPLSDPLRLHIQKQITAALEEITPGNGYVSDFSASPKRRVFRGRAVFGQGDPLPMLSILEVPIPQDQAPTPQAGPHAKGGWELMIQGFFEDDKENPTDPAHVALADVKRRLTLERQKIDYTGGPENGPLGLGTTIIEISLGPGVVRPPDEISAKAYFWLTIELEVVEDLTDPYGSNL